MRRSPSPLQDRQRVLVDWLRISIVAHPHENSCEAIQALRHSWSIRIRRPPYFERALDQCLGGGMVTRIRSDRSHQVKTRGEVRIVRSQGRLADRETLLQELGRILVSDDDVMPATELVN